MIKPVNFQGNVVDSSGSVIPNAQVTVTNKSTGFLPILYSDLNDTPLVNPFNADANGAFKFYTESQVCKIKALDGGFVREWEDEFLNDTDGNYPTLQDAISAPIDAGQIITTTGYHTVNDGGAGQYIVVPQNTGTDDGGSYLDMVNGNQLEFIGDTANSKQFGCTTDNVDTTLRMQALNDSSINTITAISGTYIIEGLNLTRSISGVGLPEFKLPPSASQNILEIEGSGINISGIKFNGDGTNNQTQNGPIMANVTSSPDLTISQCEITNFYERMVMLDTLSPFIKIYDNRIYDTDFTAQGSLRGDVFVIKASGAVIQNNTFNNIGNGHCVRTGVFGTDPQTMVENTLIDGNSFNNTQHVGCTLEEQTKFVVISNNTFNNLEQAVKCERSNNVCSDITITGNTITNITLNTALNLSVPRVIFSNNIVTSIDDGPTFGADFICSDNYFADSGRDTFAFLSQLSGESGGVVSGNVFKNLAYRAIGVADKVTITGNTFHTIPNFAVNISGSYCSVSGNIMTDIDRAIVFSGTSTNCVASLNTISNATTAPISNSGVGNIVQSNTGADDVIFDETTIASGVISSVLKTPTQTIITNNEGGAATDDIDTINNTAQGQIITLRPNQNSQLPTFKDSTGNLKLAGNADFAMTNSTNTITLLSNGTDLLEISRSIN